MKKYWAVWKIHSVLLVNLFSCIVMGKVFNNSNEKL